MTQSQKKKIEQITEKLKSEAKSGSVPDSHINADDLLLSAIETLIGEKHIQWFKELEEAYLSVERYHA